MSRRVGDNHMSEIALNQVGMELASSSLLLTVDFLTSRYLYWCHTHWQKLVFMDF